MTESSKLNEVCFDEKQISEVTPFSVDCFEVFSKSEFVVMKNIWRKIDICGGKKHFFELSYIRMIMAVVGDDLMTSFDEFSFSPFKIDMRSVANI